MPEDKGRYCVINVSGGPVVFRLQANNGLSVGGAFGLYKDGPTPQEILTWKMNIDESGADEYELELERDKFVGTYATWQLVFCSNVRNLDHGTIEIHVMQDGVSCPLTKPLQWLREEIPNCRVKKKPYQSSFVDFLLTPKRTRKRVNP